MTVCREERREIRTWQIGKNFLSPPRCTPHTDITLNSIITHTLEQPQELSLLLNKLLTGVLCPLLKAVVHMPSTVCPLLTHSPLLSFAMARTVLILLALPAVQISTVTSLSLASDACTVVNYYASISSYLSSPGDYR